MATKKQNEEIWDSLVEAFDPTDFKQLLKGANENTRLNAYINIVKLLTYRSKTVTDDYSRGKMEEMIDNMFSIKKHQNG